MNQCRRAPIRARLSSYDTRTAPPAFTRRPQAFPCFRPASFAVAASTARARVKRLFPNPPALASMATSPTASTASTSLASVSGSVGSGSRHRTGAGCSRWNTSRAGVSSLKAGGRYVASALADPHRNAGSLQAAPDLVSSPHRVRVRLDQHRVDAGGQLAGVQPAGREGVDGSLDQHQGRSLRGRQLQIGAAQAAVCQPFRFPGARARRPGRQPLSVRGQGLQLHRGQRLGVNVEAEHQGAGPRRTASTSPACTVADQILRA